MLTYYLFSIYFFYLSVILFIIRFVSEKDRIKLSKSKEGFWLFGRCIIISIIPIVNVLFALIYFYYSIFASAEKFKTIIEEEKV